MSGSSPRVRGKRLDGRAIPSHGRIIPARAGQTTLMPNISVQITDHPRACGANYALDPGKIVRPGSSPRVRGKLVNDG